MTEEETTIRYSLNLKLFKQDKFFGPGVIELLAHIERTGSLRKGTSEMGMAYSKGWLMIKRAEENLGFKLLTTETGGKNGGGAKLTDECIHLVNQYQLFQQDVYQYANERFEYYFNQLL